MSLHLAVEFTDPARMLQGERKSKLLAVESDLVTFLDTVRTECKALVNPSADSKRPWHVELSHHHDDSTLPRAINLHGQTVDVADPKNYVLMGRGSRAFVLLLPLVEGYSCPHVTIFYSSIDLNAEHSLAFLDAVRRITAARVIGKMSEKGNVSPSGQIS